MKAGGGPKAGESSAVTAMASGMVLLGISLFLPAWAMVLAFLLAAGYALSYKPAAVVETYELPGSSRLMDDAELDGILDRHCDADRGGYITKDGMDRVFTDLFLRMDPKYELTKEDRECLHSLVDLGARGQVKRQLFRRSLKLWYPPLRGKTALLIVDLQNDFVTGTLPVPEGEQAVSGTNLLRKMFKFDMIAHTRDWHPSDHCSFWDNHEGVKMMDMKTLKLPDGTFCEQVMWPRHCVQGSHGAEFHPQLHLDQSDVVVSKGLRTEVDSYSGFFDNCRGGETAMRRILIEAGVTQVYVSGLALDFCVGWTAQDAATCGFESYLVRDCARAVMPQPERTEQAALYAGKGVTMIDSQQVPMPRKFTGEKAMKTARVVAEWRKESLLVAQKAAQARGEGGEKPKNGMNGDANGMHKENINGMNCTHKMNGTTNGVH